jgi:uncharacterized peroxidase-related enzyme
VRLPSYERAPRSAQRGFVLLTRISGAELDDVGKTALRRPDLFGKPFLALAQALLREPSEWSVGERELLAAAVSRANTCAFCVATHREIAGGELGHDPLATLDREELGDRVTAAAAVVEALTRDPDSVSADDLARARAAGVSAPALAEAIYIAFLFNVINRLADALGFTHPSDGTLRRGAWVLRHLGYRVPGVLLR